MTSRRGWLKAVPEFSLGICATRTLTLRNAVDFYSNEAVFCLTVYSFMLDYLIISMHFDFSVVGMPSVVWLPFMSQCFRHPV